MNTLYLECKMGIAGDMFAAALLGLVEDKEAVLKELNDIGVPKVEYRLSDMTKCGIVGNHLSVFVEGTEEKDSEEANHDDHHHDHSHEDLAAHTHEHSHEHHSLYDIEDIIENLNTTREVKSDIREVYQLLAEAESSVHGVPVDQIHFHEVGNMDAIADITAVCYLIHKLEPDRIVISPINVGGGTVRCAHGILPVPAPATAHLLMEIPSYESETIKSELCTPTGAALAKYFADEFKMQPIMSVKKISYGMGKKDFPQANALRALWGQTNEDTERVVELTSSIDDMTPEEMGFATEQLFKGGALEAYTVSADMKKNRPGFLLVCVCKLEDRDEILKLIFKHTTTLGVRENICNRYILSRGIEKIDTPYGQIRVKKASGYNVERAKFEYDDLAGIAARTGKSILELKKELENSN